jgi:small subunit ribosomal protein S11
MARPQASAAKKKTKKVVPEGIVHVNSTFNNTFITITDKQGNVIAWSTAGHKGFKGSRKSTPYAAQVAADSVARIAAENYGLRSVDVLVKGPGMSRESALRGLGSSGVLVNSVADVSPIPHNGCRPSKRRRV